MRTVTKVLLALLVWMVTSVIVGVLVGKVLKGSRGRMEWTEHEVRQARQARQEALDRQARRARQGPPSWGRPAPLVPPSLARQVRKDHPDRKEK